MSIILACRVCKPAEAAKFFSIIKLKTEYKHFIKMLHQIFQKDN